MAELDWQQVETIIDRALELPEHKRSDFIDRQCIDNISLKSEVTLLLESIFESEGWLDNSDGYKEALLEEVSDDLEKLGSNYSWVGRTVGAYTVQKELGEGGMGSVYLAERSDGTFDHQVAIKVIRDGKASAENISRFEQERSILADLNHPGVAKLFDGGITEDGYPYLIMEYIDGMPVTDYCQKHSPALPERINLFKKILSAVRHAHENAVIHRDLKPGNILVTEDGEVKILDFGISKMLDEDTSDPITQTKVRVLTPRYAAPEQIKQKPVTTATDIYALGILFYQLLSGKHPFDLKGMSQYEIEQAILNQDAAFPSSIVSNSFSVAKNKLRGDLDAIALKAIRKEPDRRYRMANEFLHDLHNYEQELPVTAHQNSYRYRSHKFLNRHKTQIGVATGVFLLVMGMVSFYTWKLTQERNIAQFQADKAEVVTDFLVGLFEANDPNNSRGETVTARQLLKAGEQKINELNDQPAIKGEVLEVLGDIYGLLSDPQKADSLQEISLSIKKDLYTSTDPELASIYTSLASTRQVLGQYANVLGLLDTSITYQQIIYGHQSKEVGKSLRLMAENYKDLGKIDSAYSTILRSKKIFDSLGDTTGADYLEVLMEMGAITVAKGDLQKSEELWRNSQQLSNQYFESPHPKILTSINGLASVLKEIEKFTEAEQLYMQSIAMTEQLYGNQHINTAITMNNLAGLYYYTQEYQKSDNYYSDSITILENVLGKEHPFVTSTLYNQANLKADMGQFKAAEELYQQVLQLDIAQFGEIHPNVASDMTGLATLYKKEKQYDEAISYYNKSIEIRQKVYNNPNHPYISNNKRSLAEIMVELQEYTKAKNLYKDVLSAYIASFGRDHPKVKTIATDISSFLTAIGKNMPADSLISRAIRKK